MMYLVCCVAPRADCPDTDQENAAPAVVVLIVSVVALYKENCAYWFGWAAELVIIVLSPVYVAESISIGKCIV